MKMNIFIPPLNMMYISTIMINNKSNMKFFYVRHKINEQHNNLMNSDPIYRKYYILLFKAKIKSRKVAYLLLICSLFLLSISVYFIFFHEYNTNRVVA